ncbi:MAG TPA: hypothetical protein VE978_25615 [Chitinophagales bacterium]|nr:hypothetical protein [Chitinophagales bacterium]
MQWIAFVLAIIVLIYRFISKQKREQEEAERRRRQIPPNTPATTTSTTTTENPENGDKPQPKTIEEILREMHRRVETQSKPYAKPVAQRPVSQKPAAKKEAPKPLPKVHAKKEPEPFLTEEYSAYKIEEAKIPANMAEDFIKQGQLSDIYNVPKKKYSALNNFNLQDAVVAQIILQRPEW